MKRYQLFVLSVFSNVQYENKDFNASCYNVLGYTRVAISSLRPFHGQFIQKMGAKITGDSLILMKIHLPGALFAILLKQVVKTSYKWCIGSSSLAAILIHYWHQRHCPVYSKLVKDRAVNLNSLTVILDNSFTITTFELRLILYYLVVTSHNRRVNNFTC